MFTFVLEGAANTAVHIAPSSARVDEGQSAILLLKLILSKLLFSLLATIYPIAIFLSILFLVSFPSSEPSVYMSRTFLPHSFSTTVLSSL